MTAGPMGSQPSSLTLPLSDLPGPLPVRDATPDVPSSFEDAVAMGMHLLAHADDVKWGMGDLLVALVDDNAPTGETDAARKARANGVVKSFAEAVKAVSRNTLKGYYEVASFYQPINRTGFDTLSWSHFREGYRSHLPIQGVLRRLIEADANDWPVGALRRALAGPETATTVTMKRVYAVTVADTDGILDIRPPYEALGELRELMSKPGFRCELRVGWDAVRETVTA